MEEPKDLVTTKVLVRECPWLGSEGALAMDRQRGIGLAYYRLKGKRRVLYSLAEVKGSLKKVPVEEKGTKQRSEVACG